MSHAMDSHSVASPSHLTDGRAEASCPLIPFGKGPCYHFPELSGENSHAQR